VNARLGLGILAVAAYAGLCYWLMLYAANAPWAVAALFGPWLLPLLGVALRLRQPLLTALALGAAAALVWLVARGGLGDVKYLYLAQHVLIHAALAASFGWTLRPGSTPLITAMARRVHVVNPPTPGMEVYTRKLTAAWTVYFAGMATTSLAVFAWLPWTHWSLLANLITPVSAGLMFVGEYLLRYWWHPEFERISFHDMVRHARQHGGPATPVPPKGVL